MFVVRYPDGTAVTYNTAGYLSYKNNSWELTTKDPSKGGTWVASIMLSAGATVEVVPACKVERPEDQVPLERLVNTLTARLDEERDSYTRYRVNPAVRRLKKFLQSFDMRGNTWRTR